MKFILATLFAAIVSASTYKPTATGDDLAAIETKAKADMQSALRTALTEYDAAILAGTTPTSTQKAANTDYLRKVTAG